MTASSNKSSQLKNGVNITLTGIGGVLSALGAGLALRASEIGEAITKHPGLAAAIAAGVWTILYGWAVWSYYLWKRDSKRERVKDALEKGRLVCPCTETGEVMTYHHSNTHGSTIAYWACPNCENCELVQPNGTVLLSQETVFRPKLPGRVHRSLLRSAEEERRRCDPH